MTLSKRRRHGDRTKGLALALWVNAGLLGVIAFGVVSRGDLPGVMPVAAAQNQGPIAGGGGVFIMPAQFSNNVWGTYLLDVDSQTLAAYTYLPGQRQLQLVAARTYKYDRRLQNFNTATPSPNEVKELLDREVRIQEQVAPAPAGGGAP